MPEYEFAYCSSINQTRLLNLTYVWKTWVKEYYLTIAVRVTGVN